MLSKLLVIVVAALALNGCSGGSTSPSSNPDPAPAGSTTITIVSGASNLTSTAYSPSPITVAVGTTVSWLNNDATIHTTSADGGAWNSGNLEPGRRFNRTFSSAGSFVYHCTIHPGMVGTITVQ